MKCPQRRHRGPLGGTLLPYHLGDVMKGMCLHSGELFRSAMQGESFYAGGCSFQEKSEVFLQGLGAGSQPLTEAQAAGALPPLRSILPELQAPSTLVGGEVTFSGSGFPGTLINCSPPRAAYLLFPISPLEPLEHMTQPGCTPQRGLDLKSLSWDVVWPVSQYSIWVGDNCP